MSALQQPEDSFVLVTTTSPFWKCLPRAKSLLKPSASSLAAMSALLIRTCWALMTFQPSRLSAVRMVRPSDVMLLQPLVIIAKWPPDFSVTPSTLRPSQRVIEISLSDLPEPTLSPVTSLPAPSIVPDPTKPMFLTFSPRITGLFKWLCPYSWYLSLELDSALSYPEPVADTTEPASSCQITSLIRWIVAPT